MKGYFCEKIPPRFFNILLVEDRVFTTFIIINLEENGTKAFSKFVVIEFKRESLENFKK